MNVQSVVLRSKLKFPKPFMMIYTTSAKTLPLSKVVHIKEKTTFHVSDKCFFVCICFTEIKNENGINVTHPLGMILVNSNEIPFRKILQVHDYTDTITQKYGLIEWQLSCPGTLERSNLISSLNTNIIGHLSERNLKWIAPFSKSGLLPIEDGLKLVHSPYFKSMSGICYPSGAFCLIPMAYPKGTTDAKHSYIARLKVVLHQKQKTETQFATEIQALLQKHKLETVDFENLDIIARLLTFHTIHYLNYTPDMQLEQGIGHSTERWESPREPSLSANEGLSYCGDCEDVARDVYQSAIEISKWFTPSTTDAISAVCLILQLYAPTIEQGSVGGQFHSAYITEPSKFRNHIWAGLHSKLSFQSNCKNIKINYTPKWPVEKILPHIHLEGTGSTYSLFNKHRTQQIKQINTDLDYYSVPDHTFYKHAIACMTGVFADQGVLDFTYTANNKYGIKFKHLLLNQFSLLANYKTEHIQLIKQMIRIERPIYPITTNPYPLNNIPHKTSDIMIFTKQNTHNEQCQLYQLDKNNILCCTFIPI